MRILFLCFHGLHPDSGVSKKILAQAEALRSLGHTVWTCTYDVMPDGHRVRRIDGQTIQDFGTGRTASLRKRVCYGAVARFARQHGVELVYVRSWHNANPWTIRLFRRLRADGARLVMEIPTYPYDQEYADQQWKDKLELQMDRLFRRRLAMQTDGIVTFADRDTIFGQRTIRISNGFDPAITAAARRSMASKAEGRGKGRTLRLIAVAEVHFWHGLDRVVEGLGLYKGERPVELHIVGGIGPDEMAGSKRAQGIAPLIEKYGIADKVKMHGTLHGARLEEAFANADFAIGSLGRHRSGITRIKTLKNREYAARGLAFCYSEEDEDFDSQPYVMHITPDETPVDIASVVDFIDSLECTPEEIMQSVEHLSWPRQMERVVTAATQESRHQPHTKRDT